MNPERHIAQASDQHISVHTRTCPRAGQLRGFSWLPSEAMQQDHICNAVAELALQRHYPSGQVLQLCLLGCPEGALRSGLVFPTQLATSNLIGQVGLYATPEEVTSLGPLPMR